MMKKPYLIALDMDGTLLNSKKLITKKTARYLKYLSFLGHKIVISSGRPYRAIKTYYESLKLKTPVICYNGAYIFSPKDTSFKPIEFEFPKEIIKSLYNSLLPYSLNFMCETNEDIWLDKEDIFLAKFFWYEGMNMHYGSIKNNLDSDPMTFIAQLKDESFGKEDEVRKIIESFPELCVLFWGGSPYYEIHFKNISKGSAIKELSKYYDIPKERIIVFGDAENDVEMFKASGVSIAMNNGNEELKKIATHVSLKSNDEDGIYYTLKAFFKGKL